MLGKAKPYFELITQSEDRAEVERAAEEYKRKHPGAQVVVDHWKDHIQHNKPGGYWRARARITEERSMLARLFQAGRR